MFLVVMEVYFGLLHLHRLHGLSTMLFSDNGVTLIVFTHISFRIIWGLMFAHVNTVSWFHFPESDQP